MTHHTGFCLGKSAEQCQGCDSFIDTQLWVTPDGSVDECTRCGATVTIDDLEGEGGGTAPLAFNLGQTVMPCPACDSDIDMDMWSLENGAVDVAECRRCDCVVNNDDFFDGDGVPF